MTPPPLQLAAGFWEKSQRLKGKIVTFWNSHKQRERSVRSGLVSGRKKGGTERGSESML